MYVKSKITESVFKYSKNETYRRYITIEVDNGKLTDILNQLKNKRNEALPGVKH
jgi:hypothetical protein